MAKKTSLFVCQECGTTHAKWAGKCDGCGIWDSLVEESNDNYSFTQPSKATRKQQELLEFVGLDGMAEEAPRISTHMNELDRVLGGGLVNGSAILIGGDPGIGKSTLLLQATTRLAEAGHRIAYISGEESIEQIRLRAKRLGCEGAAVELAAATSVATIVKTLNHTNPPKVLIIDSIQTMFLDTIESAPGTVSQVRASAYELINVAKRRNVSIIFVGHVTKEGQIAGPRVLEHMVDTVLYFEGERGHPFRILRAVKNRFGAANEIGVFEMAENGLQEVPNPSALFLAERGEHVAGSAVFAGMEGTRPVLVEVQALVAPTQMATPRRAVIGWDNQRLAMLIAVLATRFDLNIMDKEVYLNIAGGLRIQEPAADLAVAAALVSATKNIPLPTSQVIFGEIGLAGEIRQVGHTDIRLKEALKLGFTSAVAPKGTKWKNPELKLISTPHIQGLEGLL